MVDDRVIGFSPVGSPIFSYGEPKTSKGPAVFNQDRYEAITAHICKHVGEIKQVFHESNSEFVHIDVIHVPPGERFDFHILITSGLSYLPMNAPPAARGQELAELVALLPRSWEISNEAVRDERYGWPLQWLKELARFPHRHDAWVGFGHTFPAGDSREPLATGVGFTAISLMPSRTLGYEFFGLDLAREKTISFFAIIPLYQEELEFKFLRGVEPLFRRFDRFGIGDVIDVGRANVCSRRLPVRALRKRPRARRRTANRT